MTAIPPTEWDRCTVEDFDHDHAGMCRRMAELQSQGVTAFFVEHVSLHGWRLKYVPVRPGGGKS